jgi:RNA polymerase sigma-70 factor (ECF subfamily)
MEASTLSDKQLIERCRDGDDDAFEVLYRRYRLQLYSYLNRALPGRSATVDDVYQQTWIRVVENLDRYSHSDRFLSWLFKIAHNLIVDEFRRSSRFEAVELTERLPDPGAPAWTGVEREEFAQAIEEAMDTLSPEQREVFMLRRAGVSFKEIAKVQNTGINTVLGRMHYAMKHVRAFFASRF